MKETEGSSSQVKTSDTTIIELTEESKTNKRNDDEKPVDRSKFKKVEMLVFNGIDLDSWLFRAN